MQDSHTNNIDKNNESSHQDDNKSLKQEVSEVLNDDLIQKKDNEISQLNDNLLRAIAENENIIKRYERQLQEAKEYSIFNFAKNILSVLDDLGLALSTMEHQLDDSNNHANEKIKNAVAGIEMTQKKLLSILNQYGIEKFEPKIGDNFDSNIHHVLLLVKDAQYEKGAITNVMQVGYKLKDRLLRPAMVSVAE
ncbi:grpE family protein [Orientia chuto str. Dubai]|uniref:Protein GrpE n=1 Tax=Orientia chuto str. Dubai TaxID=1359168 RepID=A0A0F3MLY3_9RICK|nr:nucleotide exchange factor GrpE [Candidatus Orientia mediorientalis]KJV56745.1 grpE family protein [Orientia chuto str. Dubai]